MAFFVVVATRVYCFILAYVHKENEPLVFGYALKRLATEIGDHYNIL